MVFSGRERGNTSSLLAEVSHGKRRRKGKRDGLPASDVFPITHALAFP